MPAVIIQKVHASTGDRARKAVQLQNAEIVRKMAWGSNWTRIAIGLGFDTNYNSPSSFTMPSPGFCFGVCSGPHGILSPTTAHWVGMSFSDNGMVYPHTNAAVMALLASVRQNRTVVNNVNTQNTAVTSNIRVAGVPSQTEADCPVVYRIAAVVLELYKSSSSVIAARLLNPHNNAQTQTILEDVLVSALDGRSMDNVKSILDNATSPIVCSDLQTAVNHTSINEAVNGALDHIAIAWPYAEKPINCWHAMVARWE
jgi:hypothetical protein